MINHLLLTFIIAIVNILHNEKLLQLLNIGTVQVVKDLGTLLGKINQLVVVGTQQLQKEFRAPPITFPERV